MVETRHVWQRIEYEDDVAPWHCKVCGTFDQSLWDAPCPGVTVDPWPYGNANAYEQEAGIY